VAILGNIWPAKSKQPLAGEGRQNLRSPSTLVPVRAKKIAYRRIIRPLKLRLAIRRLRSSLPDLPSRDALSDLAVAWGNDGYVADIDYLERVALECREAKGKILECGSGLTTLIAGIYAPGRVFSLEHIPHWHSRIEQALKTFGVDAVVVHAPLSSHGSYDWYSPPVPIPQGIEVVICDGPPGDTRGGRYGAVPQLLEHLAEDFIIIVDDADRPGESNTLRRWEDEYRLAPTMVVSASRPYALVKPPIPSQTQSARLASSVVIPAYQAEHTIARALHSLLTQTMPPDEIIVCDDGSTDRTADIASSFGPPVTVIRQNNQGVSSASSAAAALATGDVVYRMDADDEWLPGRLQAMSEYLSSHPSVDVVTTDAEVKFGSDTYRYYSTRRFPRLDDQRRAIISNNFIFGSAGIRRTALERTGAWRSDVTRQGEYELWLRLIFDGSIVGLVDEPLAVYHRQPNGLGWEHGGIRRHTIDALRYIDDTRALSPPERKLLRQRIRSLEGKSAVSAATHALAGRSVGYRRACFKALLARGVRVNSRVKMLGALVAPAQARRHLGRQRPASGDRDPAPSS
jgi:cellulose synthase/poly-beta-1,6-N-acetylglucosamine synthase-like glycosyltransferase